MKLIFSYFLLFDFSILIIFSMSTFGILRRHIGRYFLDPSFSQWQCISIRRRGRGCEVDPRKFHEKLEKQLTKMAANKHGIQFSVPTGSGYKQDVTLRIFKKKRKNSVLGDRRNTALAATIFPYVCDVVQSGELGEKFSKLGITLTKMEFASNLTSIRLYWYSDITTIGQETLQEFGSRLRECLAVASILPTIPPVVFILDEQEVIRKRLDEALATVNIDSVPDQTKTLSETRAKDQK